MSRLACGFPRPFQPRGLVSPRGTADLSSKANQCETVVGAHGGGKMFSRRAFSGLDHPMRVRRWNLQVDAVRSPAES